MPAGSQKAIYDRVVILYAEKWAVEENKELNKDLGDEYGSKKAKNR